MVALVGQIKLDGVVARLVDLEVLSIKFRQVVEVESVVVGTTPRDSPVVVGAEFQFACNQIARPCPSLLLCRKSCSRQSPNHWVLHFR